MKIDKKFLKILGLISILLICGLFANGTLSFASLYGGNPDNEYGGTFSISEVSQYGNIVTNFVETTVESIDFSVTNNVNSAKTITPDSNTHKEIITVTSSEVATDYQVKFIIPYQSEMETDFSDLRFQLADGTNLDQWRESYTDSTTSTWWIKTDLEIGDNDVVVTYGGDLPLKSDGEAVFDFFNDANSVTGWTGNTAQLSIVDERLKYLDATTSAYTVYLPLGSDYTTSVIVESKLKVLNYMSEDYLIMILTDGASLTHRTSQMISSELDNKYYAYNGGNVLLKTGISYDDKIWHMAYDPVSDTTDYKIFSETRDLEGSVDNVAHAMGTPNSVTHIALAGGSTGRYTDARLDWILVRKFMTTEPTYSIGSSSQISYDFTKQQIVTLDNSGGNVLTNYHMPVTVSYDSDMQIDFDDVRFLYTNDVVIPTQILSKTDSTTAVFDIEVDVLADSTLDIVMLYGNDEINEIPESSSVTGYSLPLGTSKYVSLGSYQNDFGFIDEFAYECDVYMPSATDTIRIVDLGYQSGTTDIACNGLNFDVTNGVINFRLQQGDFDIGWGGSTRGVWTTSANLNSGWNHIKVTRSATEANVYLDGILADTQSFTGTTLDHWGTDNGATNRKYILGGVTPNGDDNDYYYSATNSIIRNLNIYTDADATNLVAQWNVGEGTGTDVYDSVGSIDGVITGATWAYLSGSSEPMPSISFASEQSFVNPTIEVIATGDSNSQSYGLETKEFTVTPTSDISQFAINTDAINFDFTADVHYTGATSITAQNATEGTMTFTFTPDIAIENGYANAIFSETVNITNPQITATLDDESVNSVFENNTVSILLNNVDTTLHTVNVTITETIEEETPVVPSSSGGGSSYTPPVVEETNETETVIPNVTTENAPITKEDLTFGIENETMFGIIFAILIIIVFGMYRMSKK